MTIGWIEGAIILVMIALIVGLAFRTGYSRGRRTTKGSERE
jgi:hypothetical protein